MVFSFSDLQGNPYAEQPLRQNLGVEPYFRTEGGREAQRFADAEINRYRLYDFYLRQAEHHRTEVARDGDVLPPFPGLDGGRRGHWGGTNEKRSGALERRESPGWPQAFSRGGSGELWVKRGAWLSYRTDKPGFGRAMATVDFQMPPHDFGYAVDRFGNRLTVAGASWLRGVADEWRSGGKPVGWFAGYRPAGPATGIEWEIDGSQVEEWPHLLQDPNGQPRGLLRAFRFREAIGRPLEFHLAEPGGGWPERKEESTAERRGPGRLLVRQDSAGISLRHLISWSGDVECRLSAGGRTLEWQRLAAGTIVEIATWAGAPGAAAEAETWLDESLRAGASWIPAETDISRLRYGLEIPVTGQLNADPAASGGAYEIDDIPLPFEHPGHTPLTLSGIDFAPDGSAFVCTLMGEVWKITGLHGNLDNVRWKKFAAGLDMPMGLAVAGGAPHVLTRHHLLRLDDVDGNGEADAVRRINRMPLPTNVEHGRDLRLDGTGRFYFQTGKGIHRLSADGTALETIGAGGRNPLGLGVRADGLTLSDSSEGNRENGTCTIYESDHPENARSVAKRKRLLYLPRGVDNSPGSRVFLNEKRFGPLGQSIVGVSFGNGGWYSILRESADGTPQAAIVPQRGWFSSGACRVAVQPADGQLWVVGLDGWGDYAVAEGSLHRIRYTGRTTPQLVGWKAWRNGITLEFSAPLGELPPPAEWFVQQWNYVDSATSYGSPEVSARNAEVFGHDRLAVSAVTVAEDRRSLHLALPGLHPAMCTQINARLAADDGSAAMLDAYFTLQHLPLDAEWAAPAPPDRPRRLVVPERKGAGDTNQRLIEYFDHRAGRKSAQRPLTPAVSIQPDEITYGWIREHLLVPHCLQCHGPGMPHELTNYQAVRAKLRPEDPEKSTLHGMIHTGSMPPYPLPLIHPSTQNALLEWIRRGAPE